MTTPMPDPQSPLEPEEQENRLVLQQPDQEEEAEQPVVGAEARMAASSPLIRPLIYPVIGNL